MTKKEINKMIKAAKEMKGKRRNRFIDESEINIMAKLDRKRSLNGKTIRVYSKDGFVANSYKYRADIDAIERTYIDNKKVFAVIQVGAKRSHGGGALVTVNSRAYDI